MILRQPRAWPHAYLPQAASSGQCRQTWPADVHPRAHNSAVPARYPRDTLKAKGIVVWMKRIPLPLSTIHLVGMLNGTTVRPPTARSAKTRTTCSSDKLPYGILLLVEGTFPGSSQKSSPGGPYSHSHTLPCVHISSIRQPNDHTSVDASNLRDSKDSGAWCRGR